MATDSNGMENVILHASESEIRIIADDIEMEVYAGLSTQAKRKLEEIMYEMQQEEEQGVM